MAMIPTGRSLAIALSRMSSSDTDVGHSWFTCARYTAVRRASDVFLASWRCCWLGGHRSGMPRPPAGHEERVRTGGERDRPLKARQLRLAGVGTAAHAGRDAGGTTARRISGSGEGDRRRAPARGASTIRSLPSSMRGRSRPGSPIRSGRWSPKTSGDGLTRSSRVSRSCHRPCRCRRRGSARPSPRPAAIAACVAGPS